MKALTTNAIESTARRFARLSETQLSALAAFATKAEENLRAYGHAESPLEKAKDGTTPQKRAVSALHEQSERAQIRALAKREDAKLARRAARIEAKRRAALREGIQGRAAFLRENGAENLRLSPAENEARRLSASSQIRAAFFPEIKERAITRALGDACLSFMVTRLAHGVADYRIRRFQERRLGMTRKATSEGRAVWEPLAACETQSAFVSDSTREEMISAARSSFIAALATSEEPIALPTIIAAHREARLVLNRHFRDTKRERAIMGAACELADKWQASGESEDDFLSPLSSDLEPDVIEAAREVLTSRRYESANTDHITARERALSNACEKARRALAAFHASTGKRQRASALASDLAFLSLACDVVRGEGADSWHSRQNTRTALYKRAARFSDSLSRGLALIGERADTLAALYGEEVREATKAENASQAARILPDERGAPSRPQVEIRQTITQADKTARLRTARRESRAASLATHKTGVWFEANGAPRHAGKQWARPLLVGPRAALP